MNSFPAQGTNRQQSDGMDISAFFDVLRRRILIIAVTVLAAAGGAYFISKGQDEKYSSSAKLLLQGARADQPGAQGFGPTVPASVPDKESLVTRNQVLARTRA